MVVSYGGQVMLTKAGQHGLPDMTWQQFKQTMTRGFDQQDTITPAPDAVFAVRQSNKIVHGYAQIAEDSQPHHKHLLNHLSHAVC